MEKEIQEFNNSLRELLQVVNRMNLTAQEAKFKLERTINDPWLKSSVGFINSIGLARGYQNVMSPHRL